MHRILLNLTEQEHEYAEMVAGMHFVKLATWAAGLVREEIKTLIGQGLPVPAHTPTRKGVSRDRNGRTQASVVAGKRSHSVKPRGAQRRHSVSGRFGKRDAPKGQRRRGA